MFEAIVCEACGAKFRADRNRCPRCRRVIVSVDPAKAAASSRRMIRGAAALVGVFLLVVLVLWWKADRTPAATAATSRPSDPRTAQAPRTTSGATAPLGRPEPGVAFLDPSGAATLAYQAGDYPTALAQFQEAVQKNPNDAESLSNLGQVLVKLGRPEEALPHFERATTLNSERWAYRFNLARALGLLGRWQESIASYEHAQRLFPDDYVTTFNLAMALHKSGNEVAAVEQYRKAIELNPEDASFRLALANSHERLQNRTEAVSAYSEYLRLSPTGPEAEQVRVRIAQLNGAAAPAGSAGVNRGSSYE